jgi:hypothetical protein
MAALDEALRFGGFVMAHAAWIASSLATGELICPFAVVTTGDARKVIPFEAETQAAAIENGKHSFEDLKWSVDAWALAREGLFSVLGRDQPKIDSLLVSSWVKGLDEPIILRQLFRPKEKGGFGLIGQIVVAIHGMIPSDEVHAQLLLPAMEGVCSHPHGSGWERWSRPAPHVIGQRL